VLGNKEKFSNAFGRLVENSVINSSGHFLNDYDITESRKRRKGEHWLINSTVRKGMKENPKRTSGDYYSINLAPVFLSKILRSISSKNSAYQPWTI
jgi:hypothetical protein